MVPTDDMALLRSYEPVVRYTGGELFLPVDVGSYVAQCSLWDDAPGPLVPAGKLDLDQLAELGRTHRDRPLHLRFVQQPLDRAEMRAWRAERRPRPRGTSRLAAVGLIARLIDVLLRASLLVRGRVPGGLVAAAERTNRTLSGPDGADEPGGPMTHPCYGRVVRAGGWTVLQYWFFYAFNDWRSTFRGVNDHEADWETVAVYLVPDETAADGLRPAWVAFSSHDHRGDDLRRRWDDPLLVREGDHPVVFAGAGSHSGAFVAGDYVVAVEMTWLRRLVRTVQHGIRTLAPWLGEPRTGGFAVPFVDYARGDGIAIGPGHERVWAPEMIDEATPWVRHYRGLWGLDTNDAFGGERAPAGPRYERDGTVRRCWADPLGWAGLDKVAPTPEAEASGLRARVAELDAELAELDAEIAAGRTALHGLRSQACSLDAHADTRSLARQRHAEVRRRQQELTAATERRTRLAEERDVHLDTLTHPPPPEAPDAHLRHPYLPYVFNQDRRTRFLRVWAAVSTPLLIAALGTLLLNATVKFLGFFALALIGFAGVESFARRRMVAFLGGLAVVAGVLVALGIIVVAVIRDWQLVFAGLLGLVAVILLVVNLREFLRG